VRARPWFVASLSAIGLVLALASCKPQQVPSVVPIPEVQRTINCRGLDWDERLRTEAAGYQCSPSPVPTPKPTTKPTPTHRVTPNRKVDHPPQTRQPLPVLDRPTKVLRCKRDGGDLNCVGD
jgi:hypothetical protein